MMDSVSLVFLQFWDHLCGSHRFHFVVLTSFQYYRGHSAASFKTEALASGAIIGAT